MDPEITCPEWQHDGSSVTYCSLIHDRIISTLSMWSTTFHLSEPSASLDENITQTEDFITMLSSTSDGSLEAEMSVYSMWTDATRMLNLLDHHRNLGGTMRRRMERLLRAGLSDQATQLATRRTGQRLLQQEMKTNFGKYVRVWLREHSSVISSHFNGTVNGGINPSLLYMCTQEEFKSTRQAFRDSMTGYGSILFDKI